MTEKEKSFLTELADLLARHNASIGFNMSDCSDTYGIYKERVVAQVGAGRELTLSMGWDCESKDVQKLLKNS